MAEPASATAGEALYERALRRLPGASTRSTLFVPPHPPYAARGEGWRLLDVDGHELIDLHANNSSLVHGHAFAPVVHAAAAALADGSAFGLPTAAEVELAERLAERLPWAATGCFASRTATTAAGTPSSRRLPPACLPPPSRTW
jgi:glutamate-1-semialdehyde 2,1-aminomutase